MIGLYTPSIKDYCETSDEVVGEDVQIPDC